MNIKITGHKILGSLLFASCLLLTSVSSAHWGYQHRGWGGHYDRGWGHHGYGGSGGGVYIGHPAFYSKPYRNNCGWVGGHWRQGYWIPGHRVCWY